MTDTAGHSPDQPHMQDLTDRFTRALGTLHSDRSTEALVELFTDDATLAQMGDQHQVTGRDGARQFWDRYRGVFDEIEATFTQVVVSEGVAALEWTSTGTLSGGQDFRYQGVSVLDGDGESITGFRTYYDSAAFLERSADTHDEETA